MHLKKSKSFCEDINNMKAEFPQTGLNKGVFSIFNQLLKFFKILKKAFLGNDDSLYYLNSAKITNDHSQMV